MTAISTAGKHMYIEGTSVNVPSNQGCSRNSKVTLSQSQYHTLLPALGPMHQSSVGTYSNDQQWNLPSKYQALESGLPPTCPEVKGRRTGEPRRYGCPEETLHWFVKTEIWILHTYIQRYANILNIYIYLYIYSLYIHESISIQCMIYVCVRPLVYKGFLDPHLLLRNIMNNVHVILYDHAMIVVTYCEIVSTVTGSA